MEALGKKSKITLPTTEQCTKRKKTDPVLQKRTWKPARKKSEKKITHHSTPTEWQGSKRKKRRPPTEKRKTGEGQKKKKPKETKPKKSGSQRRKHN